MGVAESSGDLASVDGGRQGSDGPSPDEVLALTFELVAHDLRAPLTSSRRALEHVRGRETAADATVLAAVAEALERIEAIVDELLHVERLRRCPLDQHVSLDAVLREEVTSCSELVRVELEAEPASTVGDATLLKHALRNLLANAVRHATSRVVVTARATGGGVLVAVDDDGPGVPPALREVIFQPLVRLELATEGSGLGLTLVRRIVELHRGRVWVEGGPLGGAGVRVWLPSG
jgi:signal transduction histidine kinase